MENGDFNNTGIIMKCHSKSHVDTPQQRLNIASKMLYLIVKENWTQFS